MPFKSRAQLRTCYNKRDSRWDCDKFLKETPSVCNLPERTAKNIKIKSRTMQPNEKVKGKIQTGPRGGRFFTITEKNKKGEVNCVIKVYLPR